MKSKSKKSNNSSPVQPQTQPVVQQVNQQSNPFNLTNAQIQMPVNLQQNLSQVNNVPTQSLFGVQSGPGSFNQPNQISNVNFVPPQMSNANMAFQQNIQQVPQQIPQQFYQQTMAPQQQVRGGVYGRQQFAGQNQIKQPDVFNDDEAIVEKVKE